jgi:Putative adhesin
MARWTVDGPTTLDFDGAVMLKATIVSGSISILPTDARPSLHVSEVSGQPLEVVHEAGILSISHELGGFEGALKWLQDRRGKATLTVCVPRECPVKLKLGTANAVVTGLSSRITVNTVSGGATLEDLSGVIDVNTASGTVQAQGVDGSMSFNTVSGDLDLAGGRLDLLTANTLSGKVTADITLTDAGKVKVSTLTGGVTLRLPDSTSAQVVLTSATGRIDSAFTGLSRAERRTAKSVIGTIGGGKALLNVNTVSGAIALISHPYVKIEGARDL